VTVVAGLLESMPRLEADVVFGMQATGSLKDRLGGHSVRSGVHGYCSTLR
jgi:hypothetical protein